MEVQLGISGADAAAGAAGVGEDREGSSASPATPAARRWASDPRPATPAQPPSREVEPEESGGSQSPATQQPEERPRDAGGPSSPGSEADACGDAGGDTEPAGAFSRLSMQSPAFGVRPASGSWWGPPTGPQTPATPPPPSSTPQSSAARPRLGINFEELLSQPLPGSAIRRPTGGLLLPALPTAGPPQPINFSVLAALPTNVNGATSVAGAKPTPLKAPALTYAATSVAGSLAAVAAHARQSERPTSRVRWLDSLGGSLVGVRWLEPDEPGCGERGTSRRVPAPAGKENVGLGEKQGLIGGCSSSASQGGSPHHSPQPGLAPAKSCLRSSRPAASSASAALPAPRAGVALGRAVRIGGRSSRPKE